MPVDDYGPGSTCYLWIKICNPDGALTGIPVFVILDVYGLLFFAPGFTEYDHFTFDIDPGLSEIEVIPAFSWPDGAGSGSGILVYAAMTNLEITELFGNPDIFSFGWHN